jgi:uncharacterized OB-fold protein
VSDRYLPDEWTLPQLDEHNEPYFTTGELLLERCPSCGHVQHPPAGVCTACQTVGTDRVAVEPIGVVVSATVVHHVLNPMLRDHVPYNVVVVALRDHPHVRIVGNVVGNVLRGGPDGTLIGRSVRGSWTAPLGERGIRLLQWEPA